MRVWGCEDIKKNPVYMNLRIWGCEVGGYRQAQRMHEPKDERMWGYKATIKHTQTWGYEDAGMQARAHEPEEMRI